MSLTEDWPFTEPTMQKDGPGRVSFAVPWLTIAEAKRLTDLEGVEWWVEELPEEGGWRVHLRRVKKKVVA